MGKVLDESCSLRNTLFALRGEEGRLGLHV